MKADGGPEGGEGSLDSLWRRLPVAPGRRLIGERSWTYRDEESGAEFRLRLLEEVTASGTASVALAELANPERFRPEERRRIEGPFQGFRGTATDQIGACIEQIEAALRRLREG